MRTHILLVVAVSALSLSPARAQRPAMAIPVHKDAKCERGPVPDAQKDSLGSIMIQLDDGDLGIFATYDSVGTPRTLNEGIFTKRKGGSTVEAHTVIFRPGGDIGFRHQTPTNQAPQAEPRRLELPDPLTPKEKADARALAKWLWSRKCEP